MSTPTIDKFIAEIARILRERNGAQLRDYLLIEPPLPPLYNTIVSELKQNFPIFNQGALDKKCKDALPEFDEGEDGSSYAAFVSFLVRYFTFLRDVNVDHLLETHDLLKGLLNQCILALSATTGLIALPTTISLSRTLARLAIGLDKRPDLIAHLTQRESTAGTEEAAERVTLVESSANAIREAFKKCLSERSGNASGLDNSGKPDGRRIGIYVTANICLKLFFHCKKLRSAEQIFGNIYQQSPPLALFPASQRVTYLYYLGRYHFANNHFYRAQLALQAAYDQCHIKAISHRRLILIYLITSNIILGRFPSQQIFQRQEAQGLGDRFIPICRAIRNGDLATFRSLLDLDNLNTEWLLQKRILLQLRNRCEVLVWRSLARKTFILSGSQGNDESKAPPFLDLQYLLILAIFLEKKTLGLDDQMTKGHKAPHTNVIFMTPTPNAEEELPDGYVDPDLRDVIEPTSPLLPTIDIIESIMTSLIEQGLLHGYISHRTRKFAITGTRSMTGAKVSAALEKGFPNVWTVINGKASLEVPGWVREGKVGGTATTGMKIGPGMVVNLSGVRPVGIAGA